MAKEFASLDSAGVVTHWQARGHVAARNALYAVYHNARDFEFLGNDRETLFTGTKLRLSDMTLHRAEISSFRCRVEPIDAVRVTLPACGRVALTSRRRETVAHAAVTGVACVDEASKREAESGYAGFQFEIPLCRLFARAQALTGEQFCTDDIMASIDLRAPVGASLLRTVSTLFTEVEQLSIMGLGQVACASTNELVMNLAAAAVLPRLRERLALPQRWVGASAVEGARQYIDAHAAEPIRLVDLAERFGVSLRALQVGFRKQFGCTLSEYLFRRRLDLARARLSAPAARTTVTAVAHECGFVNVGAFADRYRRAFGELPSQTLRSIIVHRCGRRGPDFPYRGQHLQRSERRKS